MVGSRVIVCNQSGWIVEANGYRFSALPWPYACGRLVAKTASSATFAMMKERARETSSTEERVRKTMKGFTMRSRDNLMGGT